MKQTVLLLLSVFCLFSCQKIDLSEIEEASQEDGTVKVSFQIGSIEQIPFDDSSTRSVTLSSLCTRFTVAVFQNDTTKVNSANQTSGDESFGTVTMSLQPGTYQLVAIAHNGSGNCTVSLPSKITFPSNKMTDTFYYYGTLTVSEESTQSLSLKRAVSMYRLNITDEMPATVAQMKFYYTGGSSTFDATTGFGCVESRQTETFDISDSYYGQASTFEVYTFPHAESDALKMTVTALDASGNTLMEEVYENVPIKQNAITQHTTTFFSGYKNSTSSFAIEDDGQWSETIEN